MAVLKEMRMFGKIRIAFLASVTLFVSACQNEPGFVLDFGSSRLEVIINGQVYASGSTYNWGNVSSGSPIVISGMLRNRSAFGITITGTIPIVISGNQATDVSVTQPADTVIAAGSTQNFTLTITPQGMRARSAKITIVSAPGNDIFTLNLSGYRYGVSLLKDINPGAGGSSPSQMTVIGTNLYFSANDGTNGVEPWISDGTTSGTVMIHDINAGANSSGPTEFTLLGSTVLFAADDSTNGTELWRTNGTSGGTFLVRDIRTGSSNSGPESFCVFNGSLFFRASTGTGANGNELWKTDGTFANTVMVQDLDPGAGHGNYGRIFAHSSSRIIFEGDNGTGRLVYRSDGLTINNVTSAEQPNTDFYAFSGASVYSTDTGLWKITNSTASSTSLVDSVQNASGFATLGTNLLFAGEDGAGGRELWISDSGLTSGGTTRLKDIAAGVTGSNPDFLTTMGSKTFFRACETATDCELWVTDGTDPGTLRLKDINPGPGSSSNPGNFRVFGSILYFTANDGVNGNELWRTDGTDAGTYMAADINAGAASSSPGWLRVLNDNLVFSATTAANGTELYLYVPPP
jgi:ELWxxDGT repeat protein